MAHQGDGELARYRGTIRGTQALWTYFPSEGWRRERDSNPRYGYKPYNALAGRPLRPLGHLSGESGIIAKSGGGPLSKLVQQERVREGPHVGLLRGRGSGAVAALGVLEVQHVVALGFHLRHHLARMPLLHADIARGRGEEHAR